MEGKRIMSRHSFGPASLRRAFSVASIAACLALAPAAAGAADSRNGTAAYLRGDFDVAYREFQRAAETGDAVSQFNLGGMFFEGRGAERNMREAAYWFRKAAEQGVPLAQHGLAVLYYRGAGVVRDYAEAARWFAKAANQGVPNAQFNLGVLYYRGEGVPRDIGRMLDWIRKSADQGFMPAAYQLGVIYENGVGVPSDNGRALSWYQRAAAGGHPRARERVQSIIARTGLANIEDLPPMQSTGRDDTRRNDALGGIPTFIRSANDIGQAAPRADRPAQTLTDASPSPPSPAAQAAAIMATPASRTAPRPAKPAEQVAVAKPAEPASTAKPTEPAIAAKPAEPAIAAKPAEPATAAKPAEPATASKPAAPAERPGPVVVAAATPETRSGGRGYLVQLASLPSEAMAQKAWAALTKSIPDPLASQTPVYKEADLGSRGTFTRVYLGPFETREQANAMCVSISRRDSKQGCLIVPAPR